MVLTKLKEKYYMIGITRYIRIENYINYLAENIKITKERDKKTIDRLNHLVKERLKALKILYVLTMICYIGIYFSFVSYVFSDFFFLSDVAIAIKDFVSFLGTTIFVITLFFTTRFSNLYYQDLNLLSSHLISIYNQYDVEENSILFESLNQYNNFIDFFRIQGWK